MAEVLTFEPDKVISRRLDPVQVDKYYQLLMGHNTRINLVSRETGRADFDRLVAESLLPLESLPTVMSGYIDIGSGGGFPAIPILLSRVIEGDSILIERTAKKARALEQILIGLDLKAKVLPLDFEAVIDPPQVDLATLRYVKLSNSLLTRIMARLRQGGKFVYYSKPNFAVKKYASVTLEYKSSQDSILKSFTVFSK